MITAHSWNSLRATFPIRKPEWVNSFVLLGLSAVLLQDGLFAKYPGYAAMARFAPQEVWQWGLFVLAFGRLVVLVINGAITRSPLLRWVGAFLSCFAWWQISAGLVGNLGFGFVMAAGLFAHEAFNFRQAFIEDAAQSGVNKVLRDMERRTNAPSGPDA